MCGQSLSQLGEQAGDSWTGGTGGGGAAGVVVWFCTGSHGFSLTRVLP